MPVSLNAQLNTSWDPPSMADHQALWQREVNKIKMPSKPLSQDDINAIKQWCKEHPAPASEPSLNEMIPPILRINCSRF
jgi:hypothetical protein